jgi:tRNA modification GTPase
MSRAGETITAIATGAGPAGIAILRISGPDALVVGDRLCGGDGRTLRQAAHTLRRARFTDSATAEPIDDGLVAVFRAPRSWTGEDVVELQGHGGAMTMKRMFAACLVAGGRAARPGEFSERAFVNGKIDLAQAEAVADLINARSDAAQRAALRQTDGDLSRRVNGVSDRLKAALAAIEASIDFPEEIGEIDGPALEALLNEARGEMAHLLEGAGYGIRLREGVRVALTGRPNVGKSSLLNALAGRERAIVTAIPGTTRDIVEEELQFGGIPVVALDTAGLRDTDDPVERIGVDRARDAVAQADLLIYVLDAAAGLTVADRQLIAALPVGRPCVFAVNKADIGDAATALSALRALLAPADIAAVATAAPTGVGLSELIDGVARALGAPAEAGDSPLITSARHEAALANARVATGRARETLAGGLPAELIAVDIHGALQSLGEITGETAREEIIAGIFARFCIGK